MKKTIIVVSTSMMLMLSSQFSNALDKTECYSRCDQVYSKCIEKVKDVPDPKTVEEEEYLNACISTQSECHDDCINGIDSAPSPAPEQQKNDDGNQ
jgi:hypothetical protein